MLEDERKHQELALKIEQQEVNLDYHRDQQTRSQLIKQEMSRLKAQDLLELQTQQKRVKHGNKLNLANKKI